MGLLAFFTSIIAMLIIIVLIISFAWVVCDSYFQIYCYYLILNIFLNYWQYSFLQSLHHSPALMFFFIGLLNRVIFCLFGWLWFFDNMDKV